MIFERHIYAAYGGGNSASAHARTAYTGEVPETGSGGYLLGGRVYDPALRRFHNADPLSPFDEGGVNRYAYCAGDPINRVDPQGNAWWSWLLTGQGRQRGLTATQNVSKDLVTSMLTPTTAEAGAPAPAIASAHVLPSPARRHRGSLDSVLGTVLTRPAAESVTSGERTNIARYLNIGNSGTLGQLMSRPSPALPPEITVITHPGKRNVRVLIGGNKFIEPEWHERSIDIGRNTRAVHWLADAAMVPSHVEAPLNRISQKHPGSKPNVYVYVGVHGLPTGDNWKNGVRQHRTAWDHEIYGSERLRNSYPALNIELEDIAGITTSDMKRKIRRPGEHVHAYCYSGVDPLMTRKLKIAPLPIYRLP
ncbi:RHS repeat-associated core domain-containing protein [Luteibacter sp. Lutesp34]|uniref:RHS repeat-associated core domain-containing protein n=1 Tax=Luteibacter sp. Lutesp34 TaxID=3243030 RepID=UPI0039B3E3D4